MGILLFELCYGSPPFYSKDPKNRVQNILSMNLRFPKEIPTTEDFKHLIRFILQENPLKRPETSEILEHPWMIKFYDIYNIDLESLNLNNSTKMTNESAREINQQDSKASLVLRDSFITLEYLKKNGLENLIENFQEKKKKSFYIYIYIF